MYTDLKLSGGYCLTTLKRSLRLAPRYEWIIARLMSSIKFVLVLQITKSCAFLSSIFAANCLITCKKFKQYCLVVLLRQYCLGIVYVQSIISRYNQVQQYCLGTISFTHVQKHTEAHSQTNSILLGDRPWRASKTGMNDTRGQQQHAKPLGQHREQSTERVHNEAMMPKLDEPASKAHKSAPPHTGKSWA